MARWLRLLCLLAMLLHIQVFAAQSQSSVVLADIKAVPDTAPHAIAITDIPQQIDADSTFLQNLIQRSQAAPPTDGFQQSLQKIKVSADKLQQRINAVHLNETPFAQLETLVRHYQFINEQLIAWQARLQASAQPLAEDAAQLAVRRSVWRETHKATAGLLPSALQSSIDRLEQDFSLAEVAISQPLSSLMALDRQASQRHLELNKDLQSLRQQITQTDELLWNIDSPNLWSAIFAEQHAVLNPTPLTDQLADELELANDFKQGSRSQRTLLLIFLVLLLPLLIWLSFQAKSLAAADAKVAVNRTVLSRPVSAWLLLLAAGMILENTNGSYLRQQMLLLLAWLPVMRLQSQSMHDAVGRWLYATLIFFVIQVLSSLIVGEPLIFRLFVLSNTILMLMMFIVLIVRQQRLASGRVQRWVQILLWGGAILMVLALLGNLIGNVHLASLLTQATLYSMYLGLFILAAHNVILANFSLLLHRSAIALRHRTQHAYRLLGVVHRLFILALAVAWVYGVLEAFRALRPTLDELSVIAGYTLALGSISLTLGGIVLFCVSVYLSFWLAQTLRSILSEDILPSMILPRGVANSISTMSYYFLLILGLMIALTAAGFQLSQLAIILGALSVGIGFGLQTVVNNFVSGLILMVERPIQPGDMVEVSGTIGSIRDIGMRTTTLTTFDGADVVVPNGMLLSEKLTNWTLNNKRRRIEIPIGVSYRSDPKAVQALLLAVAQSTAGISLEPAPVVLFMGFGENSLDFSVRAWIDNYDQSLTIRSEMALGIHAALKAENIEIPYPQRDVNIRMMAQNTDLA
ncbi:mechanosensitive ion channel domain-containing protein [Deefgea rivuli]|uniref:mechanosensitive ion channel domain-containing protein n=1 Tax=Deefgea rivuli TaxID=400948 RepID=UPI000683FD4D|nr:mechanosensitive ion channel domain-containing protein [Deefgea rivuli]